MREKIRVWLLVSVLAMTALPSIAGAEPTPSYARPSYATGEETIHGRIISIPGQYRIDVRDDRGFVDTIELHPGTVINPTGLTLTAGMRVTITGFTRGNVFAANEIDTPYMYSGPYPYPVYGYGYYGPYYPYYPYYPHTDVIIAPSFGWGWHHDGGWGGGWYHGGWRR